MIVRIPKPDTIKDHDGDAGQDQLCQAVLLVIGNGTVGQFIHANDPNGQRGLHIGKASRDHITPVLDSSENPVGFWCPFGFSLEELGKKIITLWHWDLQILPTLHKLQPVTS